MPARCACYQASDWQEDTTWLAENRKARYWRDARSHITELMGPVATVAFQTIFGEKARRARQNTPQDSETETAATNKALLNSCYALSEGKSAALWNWGIPLDSENEKS